MNKRLHHHSTLLNYVNSARIAREYDGYHSGNRLFELDRRFLDEVLPADSVVLDIGCGTGRLSAHLRRKGYRVAGVDLSHHMLQAAREKLGDETALIRADMLALPVARAQVDACIMMFSVFGMLGGKTLRERALREAFRVLRPGGVLVLHVHNRFKRVVFGAAGLLKGFALRLFGGGGRAEVVRNYRGLPALYLHLFTRGELHRLLERAGFRLVREEAIEPDRSGFITGPVKSWGVDGFLIAAEKRRG